jgi:hypothetical protein
MVGFGVNYRTGLARRVRFDAFLGRSLRLTGDPWQNLRTHGSDGNSNAQVTER